MCNHHSLCTFIHINFIKIQPTALQCTALVAAAVGYLELLLVTMMQQAVPWTAASPTASLQSSFAEMHAQTADAVAVAAFQHLEHPLPCKL
jgi:hypothetical protein